jgi:hypothetical protein
MESGIIHLSLYANSFGIILWFTVAVFFELFTPYGLFGEPFYLVAFELML